MRVLIVGERFNAQGGDYSVMRRWHDRLVSGEWSAHDYLACMTYCSAFKTRENRRRLALLGLECGEHSDGDVWAINLMPPAEQGERWPVALARETVVRLWDDLHEEAELLVLCGGRVRDAFGLEGARWFDWSERCVVVPHPSGLSRLWNDASFIRDGRVVMNRLLLVSGWAMDGLCADGVATVERFVAGGATIDELPEPVRSRARTRAGASSVDDRDDDASGLDAVKRGS